MGVSSVRRLDAILYFAAQVCVAIAVTLAGAAPALAGSRPCSEPDSTRREALEATYTVNIANRRSTPLTIEGVGATGAAASSLTLAPGESKLLQINQNHALTSRDARRRCLSKFVPEKASETWEIATTFEADYQRATVGTFPVYVGPEFRSRDPAVLERCLQALESSAKRLQEVLPATAWEKLSGIPIWLEYEPNGSNGGVYFDSEEWLIENGVTAAKAKSIQFTNSLAALAGSKLNPLTHEVAHAYHDLVLSFSYAPVLSAYQHARLSGRYNAVRHVSGRIERAYAMSDPMEFFAELSAAYFGYNDFFPFTREGLKQADPDSYKVISQAWEHPPETLRWPNGRWPMRRAPWPIGGPG